MRFLSLTMLLGSWLFVGCHHPCDCDWVSEIPAPDGTCSIKASGDDSSNEPYDGGNLTVTAESVVIQYTDEAGYEWEVVYSAESYF